MNTRLNRLIWLEQEMAYVQRHALRLCEEISEALNLVKDEILAEQPERIS